MNINTSLRKIAVNTIPDKMSVDGYYACREKMKQFLTLQDRFEGAKKSNGVLSSIINKLFKQDKACEETIDKFVNGEIDFKKSIKKVNKYIKNQTSSLNIVSGISAVTASASVCSAVSGDIASSTALCSLGATTGAVIKSAINALDRYTNKIDGDALNKTKILKDGISGSICGVLPQLKLLAQTPDVLVGIALAGMTAKKIINKIFTKIGK